MDLRRIWMTAASVGAAIALASAGCGDGTDDAFPVMDIAEIDDEHSGKDCDGQFVLPEGESFALYLHDVVEPQSIAQIASQYVGSVPPVLLFADGLTDATADRLDLVGGIGERTGYGYDEVPGTEEDVFAMYYGSFDPDNCQFQAELQGEAITGQLGASTDQLDIDLGGFSALAEGLTMRVTDVELSGEFNADQDRILDVVLEGTVSDDGLDEMLATLEDMLPITEEQALELIDPDGEGDIPVELQMQGRKVVVDGYMPADSDDEVEPRPDAGSCCPEGLEVGDSVLPYLNWQQQGLDTRQYELFQMALPEFRDDEYTAMVATARRQNDGTVHYHVYSGGALPEGRVVFERTAGNGTDAPDFHVLEQSGYSPLGNMDPTALSSFEEFIETGINPNSVSYLDEGYTHNDPRVGFIPSEQMHYPWAMERIAQNFDDPRTGDIIVIPASWSTGGFGTHGNLGALQSRAPLLMAGPGIRGAGDDPVGEHYNVEQLGAGGETLVVEDAVRQTDIAPTVAAALGVDHTTGVGPDMRLSDEVYLGWQDGRVLEEVFTDDALAAIEQGEPVADRAIVIINDGLTNIELLYQALNEESDRFEIDFYRELFRSGLAFRYGAISNFPSNTFPGHNTVGTGAWAGHHGMLDNRFWVREQAVGASPISELLETEYLFGSAHPNLPVETLYEAIERTHGGLDDGVFTASINEPSTRGAHFASTEHREPEGFDSTAEPEVVHVDGEAFELPHATVDDYTGVMDNTSIGMLTELFQDHRERGDDGLPIPTFTFVNFASTDTVGHSHGPHSDKERYETIVNTNRRMEPILELLETLEIDDSTLLVLTADHGMELQDTSRSSGRSTALREADIEFRRHGWYYYFKELDVKLEDVDAQGGEVTYSLRVIDRATAEADEPTGVADVVVDPLDADGDEVRTGPEGRADITVTPGDDTSVLFDFYHDQWNPHRQRLDY